MTILNLKEQPHHLPTLAAWHQAEWAHLNPGQTLEDRIEIMGRYLSEDPVPSTFIGLHNDQLAGSAALVEHDMDTHPEFSPWLASVYVKPEFRNRGIGSRLVRHVMEYAAKIDIPELYLYTEDQVGLYSRLGWESVFEETYMNVDVSVMKTVING